LFIDATGKVGVGTSLPSNQLTVSANDASSITLDWIGDNLPKATFSANHATGEVRMGATNNSGTYFATLYSNNQERLRITSAGLVGLGTSSPEALLHLKNSSISEVGANGGTIAGTNLLVAGGRNTVITGSNTFQTGQVHIKGQIVDADSGSSGLHETGLLVFSGRRADGAQSRIVSETIWDYATQTAASRLSFWTAPSSNNGGTAPLRALTIDSSQRVGIGTTGPNYTLDISAPQGNINVTSSTGTQNALLRVNNTGGTGYIGLDSSAGGLGGPYSFNIWHSGNYPIVFANNNAERARIDSSGRLLIGTSTARSNYFNLSAYTPQLQLEGAGASGQTMLSLTSGDTSLPSYLILARQKSGTIGGNTIVSNADPLGYIAFQGSDGTEFVPAAWIVAEVDGTPGADDMPGRLVFSVTADGAASPTEALRISNDRSITVSDGGNVVLGTTTGTKIGTATTQKLGFYNATPVVQPAAVADATTAIDVITQLNDLLAKLRTLGIIAT
jgi:hypothetical protein